MEPVKLNVKLAGRTRSQAPAFVMRKPGQSSALVYMKKRASAKRNRRSSSRILDNPNTRPARFGGARYNCTDCPPGRYNGLYGVYECTVCEVGRFMGDPGATACTDCSAGKYMESTGSTACDDCEPGRFIAVTESTTCNNW